MEKVTGCPERLGIALARLEIAKIELKTALKYNPNDAQKLVEDIQKTIDSINETLERID
jgi:hypothetical protein